MAEMSGLSRKRHVDWCSRRVRSSKCLDVLSVPRQLFEGLEERHTELAMARGLNKVVV
jgi:hypothetical protein